MPSKVAAATRSRAVIDDFHQSGLKRAEFCRRRGLSLHTCRKYLYGSQSATPEAAPTRFLPVPHPADPPAEGHTGPTPDALILILDGGRRLAVAPGFDAATLRRLLDALEARP
jgi:hypothetical protein